MSIEKCGSNQKNKNQKWSIDSFGLSRVRFKCAVKRHNNKFKLMTNRPAQCDMTWENAGEKYSRKSTGT